MTKKSHNHYLWSTKDEINYLKTMGMNMKHHSTHTRLELLKKYKETMTKRSNWDGISGHVIMEYVTQQISTLEKKKGENK